jgi:hypothetical protein
MSRIEKGRIIETATEARAGETGGHMRWVLFGGTLAIIAIFAGLIIYSFAHS